MKFISLCQWACFILIDFCFENIDIYYIKFIVKLIRLFLYLRNPWNWLLMKCKVWLISTTDCSIGFLLNLNFLLLFWFRILNLLHSIIIIYYYIITYILLLYIFLSDWQNNYLNINSNTWSIFLTELKMISFSKSVPLYFSINVS